MARIALQNYNPVPSGMAGTGESFILGSGLAPLHMTQRLQAAEQQRQQQAAVAQQKQHERELQKLQKLRMGLDTEDFLPFHEELEEDRQRAYDEFNAIAQDETLTPLQRDLKLDKRYREVMARRKWTAQVGGRIKELVQLSGKDKRYNPAAVDAALYKRLDNEQGKRYKIGEFNPDDLQTVLDNSDVYDRNEVASHFLNTLAEADTSTRATPARPGSYGQRNTASSNYFEVENGVLKLDPVTGNRIPRIERPEVLEAAKRDPFVSKLIDQQMKAHAATVEGVVAKMRNQEPLTEQEQQLVDRESTTTKRYADYLNGLLVPHAYQRTSEIQSYARPVAVKAAKPAPKRPASEITVTPTVGFQASTYTPPVAGRFQQMKTALGIQPTATTNHYPTVGVTFGSARQPYAEAVIDNRDAQIVGQDGQPTRAALGNGKVPMQVVSRDFVLYVNGKRIGRKEPFPSDADAYRYLLSKIDELSPEQARKAELRTEYRGTLTDKTRTASDGAGGRATPTGKSSTGANTYDAGVQETRLSVIVPASQAADAQLQQASGGKWNPRQPTPEQTRAIDALRRKGGRIVTPYDAAPATSALYTRPASRTPNPTPVEPARLPAPSAGGKFYKSPTR